MKHKRIFLGLLALGLSASGVAYGQNAPADETAPIYVQSSDPFSALVGKRRERRPERARRSKVERYVLASDDRAFLFEDRSSEARLKFLCKPDDERIDCTIDPTGPAAEIYRLAPTRGPRGDIIYKNAEGDTLLRMASYGGATVFWPGSFQGLAASKSFGDDAALRLVPQSYATVVRRANGATAAISALTGAPIVFDLTSAPEMPSRDNAVLADAIVRAAKGIQDVAGDPTGARIISGRINKVLFTPADAPGVALEGETLVIGYVPGADIDGRPSSAAIARFLEETL